MKSSLQFSLLLIASFLILSSGFLSTAHADDLDDTLKTLNALKAHPEPQFDLAAIGSWKMLGTRWAAALDSQGHILGIYDLSFPNFFNRFRLGNIGAKKVTKAMIIKAIEASKNDPNTDVEKADDAIDRLNENQGGPIEDGSMPNKWWEKVPWKKGLLIIAPPAAFKLSDIDMSRFKKAQKIQAGLKAAQETLAEIEGAGFDSDLLDEFEFVKESDGSYSFFWNHASGAPKGTPMPRKMADLTNPKWAFTQSLKMNLAETAVEEVVTLIPAPAVQGLVEAALDRLFHFYDLLLHTNQNMILEMTNSVQDGAGIFSNALLAPSENTIVTESLVFAQTSLLTSFKWTWTNPLADWKKGLTEQAQYENQSLKWLQSHKMTPTMLNARFAFNGTEDLNQKALLLLGRRTPNNKTGPAVAVNYAHPETLKVERIGLELASSAVVFAVNFISFPGVSTLVKDVYKYFVENPTDISKTWEGRLTAHLEERTAGGDQSFSTELSILDAQRVNPFFDSREMMNQMIKDRKALLGLP